MNTLSLRRWSLSFKLLCLAVSMVLFGVGLGVGAITANVELLIAGGVGFVASVLWLSDSMDHEVPETVDLRQRDTQIVLRNHRGATRNIAAPMPLADAMRVAFVLSNGGAFAYDDRYSRFFYLPAFHCPGGTLYLMRVGSDA